MSSRHRARAPQWLRFHYPGLFEAGTEDRRRAEHLARRTYELTSFLADIAKVQIIRSRHEARATYHDACSGLRELGIKRQPRSLLGSVDGLELVEMHEAEACCGFGGTFCVKYPEISGRIVEEKTDNISASGADCVITGDVGCLLNIEGRLHRAGKKTRCLAYRRSAGRHDGGCAMSAFEPELFPEKSRAALDNAALKAALRAFGERSRTVRSNVLEGFDEFEALRDLGRDIKDDAISRLDELLVQFERAVYARGGQLHWARNAEEARAIILELAQQGGRKARSSNRNPW